MLRRAKITKFSDFRGCSFGTASRRAQTAPNGCGICFRAKVRGKSIFSRKTCFFGPKSRLGIGSVEYTEYVQSLRDMIGGVPGGYFESLSDEELLTTYATFVDPIYASTSLFDLDVMPNRDSM